MRDLEGLVILLFAEVTKDNEVHFGITIKLNVGIDCWGVTCTYTCRYMYSSRTISYIHVIDTVFSSTIILSVHAHT